MGEMKAISFSTFPAMLTIASFSPRRFIHSLYARLVCVLIVVLCSSGLQLSAQDYRVIVDSLELQLSTTVEHDARLQILSDCLKETLYNDLDMAYGYVIRFEQEALLSGDSAEIARSKNFFGMHASSAGDHYQAISEYEDALHMYRNMRDTGMVGMMLNNIGAAYEFQADREKSIEYFRLAYEQFDAAGQDDWAFYTKYNIAEQYYVQERYLEAEPIYQEALEYFKKDGNLNQYVATQVTLAYVRSILMGASEAKLLLEEIEYNPELMNKDTQVSYEVLYCNVLTELDLTAEAKTHCEAALATAKSYGAQSRKVMAYSAMYGYLKKTKEYKGALEIHEKLMELNDSIVNAMKDKQIVNLLTKYEIREKEKQLGLKDLELEQKAQESNFARLLLALIGVVLIGALIFIVSRVRTNQKLRKQKEVIERSLSDRELLLREIHHRVKNNLQVISSILSIQSRDITDEVALRAVNESRSRVKSMALIHQDLYGEDNLRGIKAAAYIRKLSSSLFSSYRVDKDRIRLTTDIQDLLLDVDTTVPLGLILNELVTNSLKYAFPDEAEGEIKVSFKEVNQTLVLKVSDNGIGIPEDKEEASKESFGMKMIRAFSRKLDASWEIDGSDGTSVILIIKNYKLA